MGCGVIGVRKGEGCRAMGCVEGEKVVKEAKG